MKKSVIILIFLCMLQVSFITADLFTVGYTGGGEELSIGGTPPTGDPTITPPTPPSDGGTSVADSYSFELSQTFFLIRLKRGELVEQQITIVNDGTKDLAINISITDIEQFVFPEIENFVLKSGETKNIKFNVYVSEGKRSEVYTGKINFNSQRISKFASIVLDVKDKAPLFDIKTTVLKKTIFPGRKIFANINILNLGDLKNIDVELLYYLIDFQNNTYVQKKESFAINDSFSGEVFLEIPRNIELGEYLFYSKVSYGNIMASSYDTFTIISKLMGLLPKSGKSVLYLLSLIILSFITLLSIVLIKRLLKNKNQQNSRIQTHNI